MKKVLLVNFSAPEVDRLAAELSARRQLHVLVRRYVNKNRLWERILAGIPLLGRVYASTLGRRMPPANVALNSIIEAGVGLDFIAAIVLRLGRFMPGIGALIGRGLAESCQRRISERACRHLEKAQIVLASYHVALSVFTEARKQGIRTVLNYPIAHHRWQCRLYEKVALRYPQFSAALPRISDLNDQAALLDMEIELADRVLVGSEFVRQSFLSEGVPAEKILVIPYGADSERFFPSTHQNSANKPFRIIFVGQIGERKGVSHLLLAYEKFQKKDTELWLVGDYVAGAEVYKPYRHLYHHVVNVPQSQLPELLRSADVFVLPTLVEGMPMVVLEAMACGLPVVATSHGPSEVMRDGLDGWIIPICDSEAIASRLQALYADRSLQKKMARNASGQAANWTWERYARNAADALLAD